jgi:hypothetical protein
MTIDDDNDEDKATSAANVEPSGKSSLADVRIVPVAFGSVSFRFRRAFVDDDEPIERCTSERSMRRTRQHEQEQRHDDQRTRTSNTTSFPVRVDPIGNIVQLEMARSLSQHRHRDRCIETSESTTNDRHGKTRRQSNWHILCTNHAPRTQLALSHIETNFIRHLFYRVSTCFSRQSMSVRR